MAMLEWLVADTLTGQLVGRFSPETWSFEDPLSGSAKGDVTIPVPDAPNRVVQAERVAQLRDWTTPHRRQIVVRDEFQRYWFGGPILTPPEFNAAGNIKLSFADWRAWFYAAPIRPVTATGVRRDYIHVGATDVEQNQAIADLAAIALDTIGAPRLTVDTIVASGIDRDVTFRMFKMTGEAMDNITRRERGPDWYTYMTADPVDAQAVVAHLAVSYPERRIATDPLRLFQRFFHKQDVGSNILTYKLPNAPVPPSRVWGVGPTPPPAEEYTAALNADLTDGLRLAWDEVWRLPEGVTSGPSAFEHTLARLNAHTDLGGVAEVTINPDLTDLMSWGPGDRARIYVDNGWDLVDKADARILSRTLEGRGPYVTAVTLQINLGIDDEITVDEPDVDDDDDDE